MGAAGDDPIDAVHEALGRVRRALLSFEVERDVAEDEESISVQAKWELPISVVEDELDGGYVVWCENVPGVMSQGDTEREALENCWDAFNGALAVRMGLDDGGSPGGKSADHNDRIAL